MEGLRDVVRILMLVYLNMRVIEGNQVTFLLVNEVGLLIEGNLKMV